MHIETGSVIKENEQLKNQTIGQNKWLYQQMDKNYYWYKDMPDSSKLDFNQSASSFFERLKSSKDRFSWIESNGDYPGGESMYDRFGLEYGEYRTVDGETVCRVLFVGNGSVAMKAGIRRGDWFVLSSGADLEQNQVGIQMGEINDGHFIPIKKEMLLAQMEETHTSAVKLDTIYQIGNKKIGYLFYNEFIDTNGNISNPYRIELRNIFTKFNQSIISDLIIDLRYNHGGYASICQYLCSLILADEYLGKVSGFHEFNDKLAQKQLKETGNKEDILYFPSKSTIGGNNIGIPKLYAIVTAQTASASECLINSLSPFIQVITVGTKTVGKGVGSWPIKDDNYKWQIQPITFRYYNSQHVTVPDTGLVPDIYADEALVENYYELGDVKEYLLNIALSQILGEKKLKIAHAGLQKMIPVLPEQSTILPRRKVSGLVITRNED
ncbi:MAG: S41 family peptidase [Prolixibacteraceae bacterium]